MAEMSNGMVDMLHFTYDIVVDAPHCKIIAAVSCNTVSVLSKSSIAHTTA